MGKEEEQDKFVVVFGKRRHEDLSPDIKESDLIRAFSKFGSRIQVKIYKSTYGIRYASIFFLTKRAASESVQMLNGTTLNHHPITVELFLDMMASKVKHRASPPVPTYKERENCRSDIGSHGASGISQTVQLTDAFGSNKLQNAMKSPSAQNAQCSPFYRAASTQSTDHREAGSTCRIVLEQDAPRSRNVPKDQASTSFKQQPKLESSSLSISQANKYADTQNEEQRISVFKRLSAPLTTTRLTQNDTFTGNGGGLRAKSMGATTGNWDRIQQQNSTLFDRMSAASVSVDNRVVVNKSFPVNNQRQHIKSGPSANVQQTRTSTSVFDRMSASIPVTANGNFTANDGKLQSETGRNRSGIDQSRILHDRNNSSPNLNRNGSVKELESQRNPYCKSRAAGDKKKNDFGHKETLNKSDEADRHISVFGEKAEIGLPNDVLDTDLQDLFDQYGVVEQVYIRRASKGEKRRYATIIMDTAKNAAECVDKLNGHILEGKHKIKVELTKNTLISSMPLWVRERSASPDYDVWDVADDNERPREYIKSIEIEDKATGYGYERIFCPYIDDTMSEVIIRDPYIMHSCSTILNLTRFIFVLTKYGPNIKKISVVTSSSPNNNRTDYTAVNSKLKSLQTELSDKKINFRWTTKPHLHTREIKFNNGYAIKIDRGLLYFEPPKSSFNRAELAFFDQDLQPCRATTIDIFKDK